MHTYAGCSRGINEFKDIFQILTHLMLRTDTYTRYAPTDLSPTYNFGASDFLFGINSEPGEAVCRAQTGTIQVNNKA